MEADRYRLTPCPPPPVYVATRFYTATCSAPKVGDSVTRTATATSHVSLADAEARALRWARRAAEGALVCVFAVDAFGKAGVCDHAELGHGESPISHAEAHRLAELDGTRLADLWCVEHDNGVTFYEETVTLRWYCPFPQVGSYEATVTYRSPYSLSDAFNQAYTLAVAEIQANLVCEQPVYTRTESATVTVECPEGQTGSPSTATRSATRGSLVSDFEAAALAFTAATEDATAAATAALECASTLYTATSDIVLTCPEGFVGEPSAGHGSASSSVSQGAADAAALAIATAQAAAGLHCEEVIYRATATVTVPCPEGQVGSGVTITASATSTVSQDAAYDSAVAAATAQATALLNCSFPIYTATAEYTANCPGGTTGSPSSASGYGEGASQEAADAAAYADAVQKANEGLECTPDP